MSKRLIAHKFIEAFDGCSICMLKNSDTFNFSPHIHITGERINNFGFKDLDNLSWAFRPLDQNYNEDANKVMGTMTIDIRISLLREIAEKIWEARFLKEE